MIDKLQKRIRQWLQPSGLPIWYDPAYRIPISGLEGQFGIEPRRADYVVWYLAQIDATTSSQLRKPQAIAYEHLALVHTEEYLESLGHADTLAQILKLDPAQLPVDEILRTYRLACGATLQAVRYALQHQSCALNLLGGFHRAGPNFGGNLCILNDIACSIRVIRDEGFEGQVVIVDLDAHQPTGLVACLHECPNVWIGSISAEPSIQSAMFYNVAVPTKCDNATYRKACEALWAHCPKADLAFVIAGGDVLADDRLGGLALDLRGVRKRDLFFAQNLSSVPTVWLPGGGYHRHCWQVLAGTALVLIDGSTEPIVSSYDPMGKRFEQVSEELEQGTSEKSESWLTADDLVLALKMPVPRKNLLLGWYTAEAVEYALVKFGILPHLRRLGYERFRVDINSLEEGDRIRLSGQTAGQEHLLVECVLEKQRVDDAWFLYVHWLTLRNPLADFSGDKNKLPGQEVPGLGMAKEAGEVLMRVAKRLNLDGLAYRPAYYHTAYAGRYYLRFVDPRRQGRFEALMRDLHQVGLLEATKALSQGRVLMNDKPYQWEADMMAIWLAGVPDDQSLIAEERERVRFRIAQHQPEAYSSDAGSSDAS